MRKVEFLLEKVKLFHENVELFHERNGFHQTEQKQINTFMVIIR